MRDHLICSSLILWIVSISQIIMCFQNNGNDLIAIFITLIAVGFTTLLIFDLHRNYFRYGRQQVIHFDASSLEEAFSKFKKHLGMVPLWTEYRTRRAFSLRESEECDFLSFTIIGHNLIIESVRIDKAGNHQVLAYDTPEGFVNYAINGEQDLEPQNVWK